MRAQVRSELAKQRTSRTIVALLAWLVGITLFVIGLHVLSFSADNLARSSNQLKILGLGTTLGALFAALLGAMTVTAEYRSGTIRPTLLVTPRRTRVIAAKVTAGLLAGLGVGLLAAALAAGAATAGMAVRGIPIELSAGDYAQLLAGAAGAGGLFAVVGVGIGAAVRSQVAAVAGICLWLLFLEPLLLGSVPAAGKYAPEASAGALAGAIQTEVADSLVAPGVGAALLLAYAGLAGATGTLLTNRRDID